MKFSISITISVSYTHLYANKYPFVYAAVGIHPENIEDGWDCLLYTSASCANAFAPTIGLVGATATPVMVWIMRLAR